ncbi:UL49 [Papiine alphaherpesvirus 2]|uniref:Tegument protein VP22 n=1 Tax=Cercopithecine herpesvirus 16 TaxID=340907 RepID=Q2QBC7_CHV16|nr:tegument protein VP22 [Papiine alphaherpesvirus 2]UYB79367.1 tegument protein VP22 [synthetic construct]ABA29303.1 UL49 [Papiine alphaherpesvirus 2]AHM96025.1 tegument protein VP22 [Papiine alphaherpesvirus 2]UYB79440.1 tegument protein VP22 [synthetic construct]UYB79514.1 tegument protein VP22 [Papiine alphaherpesvirus 2]
MASRRFPKPKPHGTDEIEADVYYDFIAPDPSPARVSFEEPAGRARAPRAPARGRSQAARHDHPHEPARADYPYATGSSSEDERPADPRPSRRPHAQPEASASRGARGVAPSRARARVAESPSPRDAPNPKGASAPRARKSACAAAAASASAPAAPKDQAAPAAVPRKLHFSTAPTSPTAPWTPRVAGFNKRTFCAAVGRVAATHARRAAAQLWDLSHPRNDEELNDLLGATNIRIIVCEGLNLVPRANELISPEVAQEADADVRGRATARSRAGARSASRRRPPE